MMSNALMAALLLTAAACAAAGSPEVQDGDIIFHSSTSSQSEALRLAMGSPYTHMGIIFVESDGPVVLEAVGPVKRTPLAEWVKRGDEGRFVIKRLSDAQARLTSAAIARLREAGDRYTGRPYDLQFEWSDERIYCSELVWKMYKEALDLEIGELETFRDFDLSDPVVARKLEERFGTRIPLDEKVISPARMFESDRLMTVHDLNERPM
jgi:hypothetical protein